MECNNTFVLHSNEFQVDTLNCLIKSVKKTEMEKKHRCKTGQHSLNLDSEQARFKVLPKYRLVCVSNKENHLNFLIKKIK
jgi:hypothetical protein